MPHGKNKGVKLNIRERLCGANCLNKFKRVLTKG